MTDFSRLVHLALPNSTLEISTLHDGVSTRLTVSDVEPGDEEFVTNVLSSVGFKPLDNGSEAASFGVMEFSNEEVPETEEERIINLEVQANGNNNGNQDEDDQGKPHNPATDGVVSLASERAARSGDGAITIDGDGRAFRVLVDEEKHKFASKIYAMLENTNMARYGAFLYDLDNFLAAYAPPGGIPVEDDEDEEDEDDVPEEEEQIVVIKKDKAIETSSAILLAKTPEDIYLAMASGLAEMAKRSRSGRSEFLSVMMKAMAGSTGDAVVSAWEERNPESLGEAFGGVLEKIFDAMPEAGEDDEGEGLDEVDETVGGDDAGDEEDTSGDPADKSPSDQDEESAAKIVGPDGD